MLFDGIGTAKRNRMSPLRVRGQTLMHRVLLLTILVQTVVRDKLRSGRCCYVFTARIQIIRALIERNSTADDCRIMCLNKQLCGAVFEERREI